MVMSISILITPRITGPVIITKVAKAKVVVIIVVSAIMPIQFISMPTLSVCFVFVSIGSVMSIAMMRTVRPLIVSMVNISGVSVFTFETTSDCRTTDTDRNEG